MRLYVSPLPSRCTILLVVGMMMLASDGQYMSASDFGESGWARERRDKLDAKGLGSRATAGKGMLWGGGGQTKGKLHVDIDDLDPDPPTDDEEDVEETWPGEAQERAEFNEAGGNGAGAHPPVVVLVHDRAEAIRRLLTSVREAEGSDMSLVTVYQDGSDRAVEKVVREFFPARLVRLPESESTHSGPVLLSRLTYNYRFMLEHVFESSPHASHVIILEDDLIISRDAIRFFQGGARVMAQDASIFCVSGYNDNGFAANTADPNAVYRGEHFMALGWLTSRDVYKRGVASRWVMDQVWDVPFAVSMNGRECIFPEVARTKHVGDVSMRGALTTSSANQLLWFSNIRLYAGAFPPSDAAFQVATKEGQEIHLELLVRGGERVRCLWEMLAPRKHALIFAFTVGTQDTRRQDSWDAAMGSLGLMGRGGGWDGLPRGVHKSAVHARVAGNLVILISSASPYAQIVSQVPPFPAAPYRGREELVTSACMPPEGAGEVRKSFARMRVFESRLGCEQLCQGKCDSGGMWAALADPECLLLDHALKEHDSNSLGCSAGCEHDWEGAHAPGADSRTGLCLLPTPMAMGCTGREPAAVTHKLCPCT